MVVTQFLKTPIGQLRLTAKDGSLVSVLFAEDEPPTFEATPHAILDDTKLQLLEYFEGTRQQFQLPLSFAGTVFQNQVWELLTKIPFAKTLSYSQLSKQYGDLKAIRAVASANGQNPFAIIVPCHRVIGSDGTLTGYAGGLHRKKWLLDHETKISGGAQQMRIEM